MSETQQDQGSALPGRDESGRTIVLGFARGVAPGKWARRWAESAAVTKAPALEVVPLEVSGVPRAGTHVDVMLERVAPGARPVGTAASDAEGTAPAERRAVRLYAEAVALVVPVDHPLAEEPAVDVESLALVSLLAHPDHVAAWPEPEPWADPAWAPADAAAALELVATGLGAILLPLPLARHLAGKRTHAVIPVTGEPNLPGTEIWASWGSDRDDADVQQLVGILRGRTARSGRSTASNESEAARGGDAAAAKQRRATPPPAVTRKSSPPKNSRGAQLAAAAERAKRAKQTKQAKRRKR